MVVKKRKTFHSLIPCFFTVFLDHYWRVMVFLRWSNKHCSTFPGISREKPLIGHPSISRLAINKIKGPHRINCHRLTPFFFLSFQSILNRGKISQTFVWPGSSHSIHTLANGSSILEIRPIINSVKLDNN